MESASAVPEREEGTGRLLPGGSGNPNGRPRGIRFAPVQKAAPPVRSRYAELLDGDDGPRAA